LFFAFTARETPARVPPLPQPAAKRSIFPVVGLSPPIVDSMDAMSSGPVVFSCATALSGFLNWSSITAPGIVSTRRRATSGTNVSHRAGNLMAKEGTYFVLGQRVLGQLLRLVHEE